VRLDVVLVVGVVILTLGAAASVVVPGLSQRIVAPSLDLVLDTFTTIVTLSVAARAWVRYRERGEPAALFQSAAFLVLALANGSAVALVVTGLDAQVGSALSAPGQGPLYVFTLARLLASGLLVAGSLEALRHRRPRRAWPVLVGSAIAALLILALLSAPAGSLPALGTVAATSPAGAAAPGPLRFGTASVRARPAGSAVSRGRACGSKRTHERLTWSLCPPPACRIARTRCADHAPRPSSRSLGLTRSSVKSPPRT
jgi:hypothetical protein